MKYPEKLDQIIFTKEFIHQRSVDQWYILFLIVIAHKAGVINQESYKGQIRSLRAGNQLNPKGAYHCKLTGKWYEGSAQYIFSDVYNDTDGRVEITAAELIEAIMLFTQKEIHLKLNLPFSTVRNVINRLRKNKEIK